MSRFTTYLKARVRRLLIARSQGIDLSQLDRVPDSLAWPLHRDGPDPVARLGEMREQAPVAKLTSFLGMNVWLVTGEAEARQVLADTTSYSTDIRPFMGKRGSTTDGDIGGLGFTDPPEHTRLRKLLTPEFTMRRLERLRPRIAAIVDAQLDRRRRGGGRRRRRRRPGPDLRLPDPVPGDLRAARPARRGPGDVPAARLGALRRVVRRPGRLRGGVGLAPVPDGGDRASSAATRARG